MTYGLLFHEHHGAIDIDKFGFVFERSNFAVLQKCTECKYIQVFASVLFTLLYLHIQSQIIVMLNSVGMIDLLCYWCMTAVEEVKCHDGSGLVSFFLCHHYCWDVLVAISIYGNNDLFCPD